VKRVLILFFLIVGVGSACAQKFGLKAGLNYSSISGDDYSYKPGFHAGIFLLINLSENIKLAPEVLYSAQGAKFSSGQVDYNYINIPVLVNIYETKIIFLQLGAQLGIITSANFSAGGSSSNVIASLNKTDFGLVGGLGADFGMVVINARYNWGLTEIVKSNPSAIVQKSDITTNTTIQISIGIKIN